MPTRYHTLANQTYSFWELVKGFRVQVTVDRGVDLVVPDAFVRNRDPRAFATVAARTNLDQHRRATTKLYLPVRRTIANTQGVCPHNKENEWVS